MVGIFRRSGRKVKRNEASLLGGLELVEALAMKANVFGATAHKRISAVWLKPPSYNMSSPACREFRCRRNQRGGGDRSGSFDKNPCGISFV